MTLEWEIRKLLPLYSSTLFIILWYVTYQINGTLECQGIVILSYKVIKYYKMPLLYDRTLICYRDNILGCEYKSINQLTFKKV